MKRFAVALVAAVALTSPLQAAAQEKGQVSIFIGFGYLGTTLEQGDAVTFPDDKVSNWGLHGDITYGLSGNVGLVLDGSFPNGKAAFEAGPLNGEVDLNQAVYLIGPRFYLGSGSFRPSVQGLAGLAIGSADRVEFENVDQPIAAGLNETNFAGALDLNLDLKVSDSIAVRLVQAGVVFSKFGGKSQAAPRFSFGVVAGF